MLKKVTKKCVLSVLVVVMTLMSFTIAFASNRVEECKDVDYFGTLTGTLEKAYDDDRYQMEFTVQVDNPMEEGLIRANIEVYDYYKGDYVGKERTNTVYGQSMTYWFYEFFDLNDYDSYGNKYTVYGNHESIYEVGEAVYTSNVYCHEEEE